MDGEQGGESVIGLGQATLQANLEYLNILETHADKLEAQLKSLDKLINAVDAIDDSDLDMGSSVIIPGSGRATAPVTTKELLLPESPFHKDALKHSRYQSLSEVHPMKKRELEALSAAVQTEYYRLHALDAQKRGYLGFPDTSAQTVPTFGMNTKGIDWERVAEKMSAISVITRSANECEIRWLGDQHPEINHGPWSYEEELKVRSLSAEFTGRHPDWLAIAERLGTRRTPLDCMRHATPRKSHQWTTEADQRLLKAIQMYGQDNWYLVARYVSENATALQCSNRFQKTLDESIKHAAWSPEEDARLSAAVAAYGSSWVDVAANIPGRHNDQCRERWTEQLDPRINKSSWSEEEDKVLLDYVHEHKDTSWRKVSEHLQNGRTEDMCRNRYTVLRRGMTAVSAIPAIRSDAQIISVNQPGEPEFDRPVQFKPILHHCPMTPAPLHAQSHHADRLVFLEPVVSSNPQLDKYRQPLLQHKTRIKEATACGTNPALKRRKSRAHVTRSDKTVIDSQQKPTG